MRLIKSQRDWHDGEEHDAKCWDAAHPSFVPPCVLLRRHPHVAVLFRSCSKSVESVFALEHYECFFSCSPCPVFISSEPSQESTYSTAYIGFFATLMVLVRHSSPFINRSQLFLQIASTLCEWGGIVGGKGPGEISTHSSLHQRHRVNFPLINWTHDSFHLVYLSKQ